MRRLLVSMLCLGGLAACEDRRPATAMEAEATLSDGSESLVNVGHLALRHLSQGSQTPPVTVDVGLCASGRAEMDIERVEGADDEIAEVAGVVRFLDCDVGGAVFAGELDASVLGPGYRGWQGEGLVDVDLDGAHFALRDFVLAIDEVDSGFFCTRARVDLGDGGGEVVVGRADCTLSR